MDLQAYQYWIFDLDGTLTRKIIDFPKLKQSLGLPPDKGILEMMANMEKTEADKLAVKLEEAELEYARKAVAAPGAGALLQRLWKRNRPMAILTRNKRSHALETLKILGFDAYFEDAFVLGRDEAVPKPDPDGVLKILGAWGARPEETVFVGDFQFDLMAGKAAGTATVHVDPDGLFPFGRWADWEVKDLDILAAQMKDAPVQG